MTRRAALALALALTSCDDPPNACEQALMCIADALPAYDDQPDERWQCLREGDWGNDGFEGIYLQQIDECASWTPNDTVELDYPSPECLRRMADLITAQAACAY